MSPNNPVKPYPSQPERLTSLGLFSCAQIVQVKAIVGSFVIESVLEQFSHRNNAMQPKELSMKHDYASFARARAGRRKDLLKGHRFEEAEARKGECKFDFRAEANVCNRLAQALRCQKGAL